MSLLHRARRIIANEGPLAFVQQALSFAYDRLRFNFQSLWWRVGGTQSFEIGGTSVEFYTGGSVERGTLGYVYNNERPVLDDLSEELASDDVFYDLGANLGVFAVLAAAAGVDNVVAFEPHPSTYSRLAENVALNTVRSPVSLIPLAVSDTTGLRAFEPITLNEPGAGKAHISDTSGEIQILAISGDKFVREMGAPKPSVIKIDVEGHEIPALTGFDSILEAVRVVYCEIHSSEFHRQATLDDADVSQVLSKRGFEIEIIHQEGPQTYIKATK